MRAGFYPFGSGSALRENLVCEDVRSTFRRGDGDGSGTLELTDGVFVLNFLFLGGAAPSAPGPSACGPDPEGSRDAGCESYDG